MARIEQEVRIVKVDSLALDLSNYRFAADQQDESLAFNYLFTEYDVLAMALSLLREGYTTNELPLVVDEGGKFVVLEANRRISALRALRHPQLVPAFKARLEALVKRHREDVADLPDEIYVTVFPDRRSAAPLLARQHIGEDKKGWGLDEQAKFVLAQLRVGVDVQYLKETLPGIRDVVRLIRMGHVRQALESTTFTDPSIGAYAAGSDLKMSAFEYAYRSREIQPLMGFTFDSGGNVVSRPTTPEQIAVLERVLRGFKSGELSTRRVLNAKKSPEYATLVAELRILAGVEVADPTAAAEPSDDTPGPFGSGARPAPGPAPGGVGEPGTPASTTAPANTGGPGSRGPNSPDTQDKLSMNGLDHMPVPEAFAKRLHELRTISLKNHPTATTMLLRSVIEAAIKEHFAQRNETVNGELGRAIDPLFRDYAKERSISHAVHLLKGGRGIGPGSLTWFNSAAHSMHVTIPVAEIHQAWREMFPLLRFLLRPPAPATP